MRSRNGPRCMGVSFLALFLVWGCGDGGCDGESGPPPGSLVWAVRAGGTGNDYGQSVAVLFDGSALVTGEFWETATFGAGEANETSLTSDGFHDMFLARYNADGTLDWVRCAGGMDSDRGFGVAALSDGSALVTGHFWMTATFGPGESNETSVTSDGGSSDIFLARYSPDGTLEWARRAGGPSNDFGWSVAVLSDGSALVTGEFVGTAIFGPSESNETSLMSGGLVDIFLARYNPDGTLEWARRAGGTGLDVGLGGAALADGSALVTGYFGQLDGTATFGPGESNETKLTSEGKQDVFFARYAPDGTLAWARRAGGTGWDEGHGVAALSDGCALVTGYFENTATFGPGEANETSLTSGGSLDIFLARYNPDGTLDWARRAGGTGSASGYGVAVLSDGSAFVMGGFGGTARFGPGEANETSLTSDRFWDIFLARYNPDGTLNWVRRAGGTDWRGGYSVAVLSDGSAVVTGYFEGTAIFGPGEANETSLTSDGGRDIFLARFNP